MLATAATNGAIIIWNIAGTGGQKQKYIDTILNEHKRIVNKINFHPSANKLLASGSQDGSMRLFDLRIQGDPIVVQMTFSQTESVRDVQWNPHNDNQIAAVSENGQVQLWDIRKCDKPEIKWSAHPDHIYTCDWHPDHKNILATAGRDKCIKVWDITSCSNLKQPEQRNTIYAMEAVNKVHWRPQISQQIASISLMSDFAIQVWDLQRPYVPFASFTEHTDIPTSFLWRGEPNTLLSAGKDNRLYQHAFADAKRPALQGNPIGLSFNVTGDLMYAFRDGRTQEIVPAGMGATKLQHHTSQSTNIPSKMDIPTSKSDQMDNIKHLPTLSQRNLQAYYERVINNPQELFRSNSSFMVQISSLVSGNDSGVIDPDDGPGLESLYIDEDDEGHLLTNQHYIKYTAQNYKFNGMPFTSLCDHNSKVASQTGRLQLAAAWQVIKSIYLTENELMSELLANDPKMLPEDFEAVGLANDVAKVLGEPNVPSRSIANANNSFEPSSLKNIENVSIDASIKGNHEQFKESKVSNCSLTTRMPHETSTTKRQTRSRRKSSKNKISNDSEQESSDDCDEGYNDTLTNIASGHMLSGSVGRGLMAGHQDGDFFGDMENAILYSFDNLNPNNFPVKSEPDFSNLPTEAFEYRRELPEESLETSQSWHRNVNTSEPNFSPSIDGKEDQPILQTTVTVVNNTVSTLYVDTDMIDQIDNEANMWNPDHILVENLEYYSNLNDVQNAIAMYIVALDRMKDQRCVNSHILSHWFSCYIEQLQQMELFAEANEIMQLCPLTSINTQTTNSTFIKTHCGNCGKLIETNRYTNNTHATHGRCKKCHFSANLCSICHEPVQGLYVWCQGCGHGGHIDHISDWLTENKKCPSGCGHKCEYE